jgi:ferredoxin--NADP+ reductase
MSTEFIIPDVPINLVKPKDPVEVPILESKIATAASSPNFIRHITFDVSGTPLENNIRSGQSIGILAPGVDEKGKPHSLRLYSVASPTGGEDGNGKIYATTVKRVIDENWDTQDLFTGVASNYFCSLKPGMTVKMTGPSGKRYLLPENPENFNYIFFATGTGIAPFRGMIMDLVKAGSKNEMVMVFGCPYRTDLLYADYFNKLDADLPNFHYLKMISREEPRSDGSKPYVQSALTYNEDLLGPILRKDNTLIYICGLKGMEEGILKTLLKQGLTAYVTETEKGLKHTDRMFVEVY